MVLMAYGAGLRLSRSLWSDLRMYSATYYLHAARIIFQAHIYKRLTQQDGKVVFTGSPSYLTIQPNPDPQSWTLLFKNHKTTILLLLQPHESLTTAKSTLLKALQARKLTELNGVPIPADSSDIELGVAVDRNDPEKGWARLEGDVPEQANGDKKKEVSLQAADLRDGQAVAFRFRRTAADQDELGVEDAGWDVVLPSLDEEEEGTA